MGERKIEADYVVIGAGLAAMAFTDTILSESEATITIVDRRHRPGGHWNDAYPFVRLHGPAMCYGVNSRPLGNGSIDQTGFNRGYLELASGAEICTYFDRVMRDDFLPGGRVTYLPMCDYGSDGVAISRISGARTELRARRKTVDATYSATGIPATDPPPFAVSPGVRCIAPNALPHVQSAAGFVIVGAGKTAMDTAIWLLEQGVDPDRITWIRPRDAWLSNRRTLQLDLRFFTQTASAWLAAKEATCQASSLDDLMLRLEAAGDLLRIDRDVMPTMFRCATVSESEVDELRRIRRVVRLGHVLSIGPGSIELEQGGIQTSPDHVHINCAADGVPRRPVQPIFQDGRIVLQFVNYCWPSFSHAFLGHLELARDSDAERNALAKPVPMADDASDLPRLRLADRYCEARWEAHEDLQKWMESSRLEGFSGLVARAEQEGKPENLALLERLSELRSLEIERLEKIVAALPDRSPTQPSMPRVG